MIAYNTIPFQYNLDTNESLSGLKQSLYRTAKRFIQTTAPADQ